MAEGKDRLQTAVEEREKNVSAGGRNLILKKWNLRQGLKIGAKVALLIQSVAPTGNIKDVMYLQVEDIILKHEDDFIQVLALSLQRGNFDSYDDAVGFVEELSLEDGIELLTHIGRMNLRPLLKRIADVGGDLIENLDAIKERIKKQGYQK